MVKGLGPRSHSYVSLHPPPQAKLAARAKQIRMCLVKTAEAISKDNVDFTAWVANCGRSVSHHSSFVPMLIRYKVIGKAESEGRRPRAKARSKVQGPTPVALNLSSETEQYNILTSEQDIDESVTKITQALNLADNVNETMAGRSPPRTCTEWCDYIETLLKVSPDSGQ